MKIASLVSGGVDSSVTIPILKEQGYTPDIFYIKIMMENVPGYINCPAEEDMDITRYIAKKYGCKLHIVDLHQEYWERVIQYTLDTVKKGLTPNPDVMCNRLIKFGAFLEKYGRDYEMLTTGHYADTLIDNGIKYLSTAADKQKDQTYFLGRITKHQLKKLHFPLGKIENKSEVRRLALEMKLPSARRPDSQGICFLGKIHYNEFIKKYVGVNYGDIIEKESGKKLGTHNGIWFHTIGQRKGLGLSGGPWFVVDKNIEENIIYVANGYDPELQYKSLFHLIDFQFISKEIGYDEFPITFKIRHTPEFTKGKIKKAANSTYIVASETPIAGVAPGQFGVVYDTEEQKCLGCGVIGYE